MSYNGWPNRETWLANLWLSDQPRPIDWDEERERLERMCDAMPHGLESDLMTTAVHSIDWPAIQSYNEE